MIVPKNLNPVDNEVNNKTIHGWRLFLKQELLKQRHYRSDFSGRLITEGTGCEMHEGIVTRAVVPKGIWWHYMIFHPYNCFLLLPEEHHPAPSKEWAISKAYALYGREAVREWFYGLPWKVVPFHLP